MTNIKELLAHHKSLQNQLEEAQAAIATFIGAKGYGAEVFCDLTDYDWYVELDEDQDPYFYVVKKDGDIEIFDELRSVDAKFGRGANNAWIWTAGEDCWGGSKGLTILSLDREYWSVKDFCTPEEIEDFCTPEEIRTFCPSYYNEDYDEDHNDDHDEAEATYEEFALDYPC
jgi:hypothetical protein